MDGQSYLDTFIAECAAETPDATDEKFIGWENLFSVLVGYGLTLLLPELREWVKLGASVITLKRLEIRKRLLDYAKSKELDYAEAEKAAGVIAAKIDEKNVEQLIAALEAKEAAD